MKERMLTEGGGAEEDPACARDPSTEWQKDIWQVGICNSVQLNAYDAVHDMLFISVTL